MARLPQLQARENAFLVKSAADYFERALPELLAIHRVRARALGGRYGVIVGAREWLVDLDNAAVTGDAFGHVVTDAGGLDAVIAMDDNGFLKLMRGETPTVQLHAGAREAVTPFLTLLDEVSALAFALVRLPLR